MSYTNINSLMISHKVLGVPNSCEPLAIEIERDLALLKEKINLLRTQREKSATEYIHRAGIHLNDGDSFYDTTYGSIYAWVDGLAILLSDQFTNMTI